MSADSHTVCPKCYPDVVNYTLPQGLPLMTTPGVFDHLAEEKGYARDVRENIDYYLQAADGKVLLVFEYSATCWSCGWHFETANKTGVEL